ncbi:MAG TPA: hypothetical protein VFG39_04515 [Balneolaceae bacterium]|nr:hypothetical protein [Balneolaceae bacterium]
MRLYIPFLILVSVLAITSCDLFNKETGPLTGSWTWQRTTGGFIGETIDADSVEYTQKLVINDESEAFLYRNDELTVAYDIRFEKPEWLGHKTWIFYPRGEAAIIPFFIPENADLGNGELILFPSCDDCYTLYFRRK